MVQSMTRNYAAADTTLSVGPDAHLDYVPEPTIVHENARYCQDLSLPLDSGGTAVLGDIVVPGRLARGEQFDFERYVSRVCTKGPDGLLFEDATHLTPAESNPTPPGVLGVATGLAGVYEREACLLCCHGFLTGLLGAAQRLLSLGHTDAQHILDDLRPMITDAVDDSADRTIVEMMPFAPLVNVLAADHERAERRPFAS